MSTWRRRRGSALVGVLWAVALLSAVAAAALAVANQGYRDGRRALDSVKARAVTEGGFAQVVADALTDGKVRVGKQTVSVDGIEVVIDVAEEASRLDLNSADVDAIIATLTTHGIPRHNAEQVADCLLDWRDGDELVRLHGAESDRYRAVGRRDLPRNALFRSVDEAALAISIDEDVMRVLKAKASLYSGRSHPIPSDADVLSPLLAQAGAAYRAQITFALGKRLYVYSVVFRASPNAPGPVWLHEFERNW